MDVSFLLSYDELFTLMTLSPEVSAAGRRFTESALPGAEMCDLTGLVEKKLARWVGSELEIASVVRMASDAIAQADSLVEQESSWVVYSPWVTLICSQYLYRENHIKITPVEEMATRENTD